MCVESANYNLRFSDYTAVFKSRKVRGDAAGSVAILIKATIKFEVVRDFYRLDLELIAVKIFDGWKKFFQFRIITRKN